MAYYNREKLHNPSSITIISLHKLFIRFFCLFYFILFFFQRELNIGMLIYIVLTFFLDISTIHRDRIHHLNHHHRIWHPQRHQHLHQQLHRIILL